MYTVPKTSGYVLKRCDIDEERILTNCISKAWFYKHKKDEIRKHLVS